MKRAAVSSILIAVVLLALGVTAEAQQPKKVPRIGFLAAIGSTTEREGDSGRVCASLGTWRGKTSSLSGDMRRESRTPRLHSRLS